MNPSDAGPAAGRTPVFIGESSAPPSIEATGAVLGGGASLAGLVAPRTPSPLGIGAGG